MEEKDTNTKNIFSKKRLFLIIAVFVFLALAAYGVDAVINKNYKEKFLPNIKIAGVEIGDLSMEEARSKLDKRIDFVNRRGFVYISPAKTVTINPSVSSLESTESLDLIVSWDIDKSLAMVKAWQENENLFNKALSFFGEKEFELSYNWDREEHQKIIEDSFSDVLTDKEEASFYFDSQNNLQISEEKIGQTFDYTKALSDTQEQIESLISTDVDLEIIEDKPLITSQVLENYRAEIVNISNRGDLYIIFDEKDWNVSNAVWKNWLKLKQDIGSYRIGIDEEKLFAYLEESSISEKVEIPVQDARFSMEDGKVVEFISSQEGRSIDRNSTLRKLENIINQPGELELNLDVVVTQPTVHNKDVNDLGIVEIIGTGESDFVGSPRNRVHNINIGADSLHGVLVKPGEEFSLIETLGEIDGEHGYLEELVIKGDQTIPEFGGGLCQIGTTVFRGTLASGLPVTQRRNHSYRVSYYEPAGTDATIYNPWPDYRFKNDTAHHILIQARIEGTKLYFDFWGTKDGRVAITTEPEIYNIVTPPEKKIIKTTEIPVGTEKCTESAHNGADAKFDYSVQYPGELEPIEETFYSHYIPWQEVCLLGVTEEELLAEQEENQQTATSTEE